MSRYGEAKQDGSHFVVRAEPLDHERVLDHLKQAERILQALNGDAAAESKLHSCKIHIWKAMDDLNEAMSDRA